MKKQKKNIITRLDEVRIETLDPSKMLNMYIAERVDKKYFEDYIDDTNGEVVTIERTQPLYMKGTLVNQDVLAKIRFDIEAGDIKEPIKLSNQNRKGFEFRNTFMQPWMAKAEVAGKNCKFLLYAQNVDNALLILRDYIELNYKGGFTITNISEYRSCVILEDTLSDKMSEDDISIAYLNGDIGMNEYVAAIRNTTQENTGKKDARKYYMMDLTIKTIDADGEGENKGLFVVHTVDTERAIVVIKAYLKMQDEKRAEAAEKEGREHKPKTFQLLIEKAGPVSVGCFIPLDFSDVYAEKE